jgi:formylglycine-generating enzyme required for sulfatase activity
LIFIIIQSVYDDVHLERRISPLKRLFLSIFIVLCVALTSNSVLAEKRVALVIGNSNYTFGPLANPKNDAALMERTLKRVGFEVISAVDADLPQMKQAIVKFGRKLRSSGPDAVGFFFYAGHGVQAGGSNYLIPTTANINDESELEIFAVNAGWILGQMESAGNAVNIIVMDACRNNPFKRSFRSASRGLARMNAPSGSFISYATAPGDVASDGTGRNSPYTTALAREIVKPGMKVEEVFKSVRIAVRADTDQRQTPWEASSLTGDFYFQPGAGAPQVQASGGNMEAMFWDAVKDSTDAADFKAYLEQYPAGAFTALARVKVNRFEKQQVAALTSTVTKPDQYEVGQTFKDCLDCPEMVVVPPGEFRMGDLNDDGKEDELPVRQVTLSKPFAVGKFEVTQAEWRTVMGYNPSKFRGDKNPVENVSWNEAIEFSKKLSDLTKSRYRLLSESEWEYAARAGASSNYHWGDGVGQGNANCSGCGSQWDEKQTAPVGSFRANRFGLHDMHGNVWEWTEDCFANSYVGAPNDGAAVGDITGCSRVNRGGSWLNVTSRMRASERLKYNSDTRSPVVGFRVAKSLSGGEVQVAAITPIPSPSPQPKPTNYTKTYKDCSDCPEMVEIPSGAFRMGDLSGEGYDTAKPVHRVTLDYNFLVGRFEVTFDEWDACVSAGGCSHTPDDEGWGRGERPVINVTWENAKEYISWLNSKTSKNYRLLSESEWEYIARAGTSTEWVCGNQSSCLDRVSWSDSLKYGYKSHPVGKKAANTYGVYDVAGNVWEWVEDCWNDTYEGAPSDGSAWTAFFGCSHHVFRGGGWLSDSDFMRVSTRNGPGEDPSSFSGYHIGFRVARTLSDSEMQQATITTTPPAAGRPIDKLKGRHVWIGGNMKQTITSYCQRLEEAGLIVECEAFWPPNGTTMQEINLNCPALPADTGQTLQHYLDIESFEVLDRRNDPANADKCGKFDAIFIKVFDDTAPS